MERFLILAATLTMSFWCIAATTSNRTPIIIVKSSSTTAIRPNSSDWIPFYCTYESSDGTVCIDFMENVGRISVTVSNLSTGETICDIADSTEGSARLYTSGDSGIYTLQIKTESGEVYEGEFTLN